MSNFFALIAVLATGVVYGTDVFCALVQRPALAHVDDRALVAVMGNVHRYGDQRMPVPGVIGIAGAAVSAVISVVHHHWVPAIAAGVAVAALAVWLVLYLSVSAPINRQLTASASRGETPANARELQHNWDRVITIRAVLQRCDRRGVMHNTAYLRPKGISMTINFRRLFMRGAPLFNAPVAALAASPRFGGLLRRSVALVTYTGRRSGRTFSIPVAYRRRGETVEIGVSMPDAKTWWRNFLGDGAPLSLTLDGIERTGHGVAHRDDKGRVSVRVRLV